MLVHHLCEKLGSHDSARIHFLPGKQDVKYSIKQLLLLLYFGIRFGGELCVYLLRPMGKLRHALVSQHMNSARRLDMLFGFVARFLIIYDEMQLSIINQITHQNQIRVLRFERN